MSEDQIIRNCAPTLAGIKTGNLFTCPCESREALLDSVRRINRRLVKKGLRLLPLRFSERKALIYLYRVNQLRRDLTHSTAVKLLQDQGYDTDRCERCVKQLACKLRTQEEFPHEIGLFLGYPPEDVHGFLTQGPDCCKCTGCWKVYGDEEAAKKKFAQYKKCTRVYCDCWEKKRDMERLTVAG